MTSQDGKMSRRLAGRRILVTGAASGIGEATVRLFAREGAKLALLDHSAEKLRAIADQIGGAPFVVELTDEVAIAQGVAAAADVLGGLDGVVNVAGIGGMGRLEDLTLEGWNRTIAVNLTAPFLVCREALPHLRKAEYSSIVNVASGQGLLPSAPGMGAYCASKGGLVMFDRTMALELAPIRVNTVCPGVVDTPLLPEGMRESAKQPTSPYALKRVADAEEIANAILFLTSRDSSFVTGIAMAIDGGRTYH